MCYSNNKKARVYILKKLILGVEVIYNEERYNVSSDRSIDFTDLKSKNHFSFSSNHKFIYQVASHEFLALEYYEDTLWLKHYYVSKGGMKLIEGFKVRGCQVLDRYHLVLNVDDRITVLYSTKERSKFIYANLTGVERLLNVFVGRTQVLDDEVTITFNSAFRPISLYSSTLNREITVLTYEEYENIFGKRNVSEEDLFLYTIYELQQELMNNKEISKRVRKVKDGKS